MVSLHAQENPLIAETENFIRKGQYEEALEKAQEGIATRADRARFAALQIHTLVILGRAVEAVSGARPHYRRAPTDPELCLELSRALRATGQTEAAKQLINYALSEPPGAGTATRIAYGRLMLEARMDPKEVLEKFFQPAKDADAKNRLPFLAIGELALNNHDRELAAENFRVGLKLFPDDPDLLLGLAMSGVELPEELADPENDLTSYADLALKSNPRFPDALLFKAQRLSDGKKFEEAVKLLNQVLKVNPESPDALAGLAAIAFVEDRKAEGEEFLAKALGSWPENPRVPEIVGTGLARHYRFKEGIEFLENARDKDPESPSINFELGSNMLRFGRLDEGWKLIEEVHRQDPYHVAAFNLITLRDRLKNFPVLERQDVKVRMSPEDAAVFGSRALDLAVKAKETLAKKYGVTLSQKVMVEMLPRQEDFAIRTFGLPGGESFLGVCFGPLITMTSPRGRLGRNNWEAVLWHEMAHTITLEASFHRIPRWLTEGISVYEERQAHAGWGQEMNADFRERFVSGKFPAISELDEAFGGEDIMLAYYQSSLVVEFIVERHGIEKIRSILADLSSGTPLKEAFAKNSIPIPELDNSFKSHVTAKAKSYGSGLDWKPLTDDEFRAYRENPSEWVAKNPKHYAASMLLISKLAKEGNWQEAKKNLERIIAVESANHEEFSPYQLLAEACKNLNDPAGERAAWAKLIELNANSSEAAARLVDLAADDERQARTQQLLAINPFSEKAYRGLAISANDPAAAHAAYLSLIALNPLDTTRLHFDLATLLREQDPAAARLHVLKALEDNPRFQNALKLLFSLPATP